MARSLGLAAYRALTRRGDAPQDAAPAPRPEGELVWIHAGEPGNMLAVQDLALRLVSVRTDLNVLITQPEPETHGARPARDLSDPRITHLDAPSEHPSAVTAFLDHWAPDAAIWVWGALRPNLILEATDRNCPMFLIDADADGFDKRRNRWLPDLTRKVLSRFSAVFARSAVGHRRLVQLGLPEQEVERTSPLLAGGQALTCVDTDLSDLAAAMGGRPAWFAANVLPKEVPIVLAAHQSAMRLSHRLLLIIEPSAARQADDIAAYAADQNLHVIRWDDGQHPDEMTQVMISDDAANQGLFFRVAPVSFLGSTLLQGETGCDPLNAAALGSAILYGPRVRQYVASYSRLAAAGAARIVDDSDALGTAVSTLIAPDHAATMAHAGWDVISQGAALTDKVIDLVQDTLDIGLSRP